MLIRLVFLSALIAATVAFFLRRSRARVLRRCLCFRCRYDEMDICDRPERPKAEECEAFLPSDDEELDDEGSPP